MVYRWAEELGGAFRASGDLAAAQQAYEIALRALENVRSEGALSTRAQSELATAFPSQPLSRNLVDVILARAALTGEVAARTSLLSAARTHLEATSRRDIRDYFQDECLALEAIAPIDTMPDALVIHPVLLEDRAELLVSSTAGIDRILLPVSATKLQKEIELLRVLVEDLSTHDYRKPAARLYTWLIKPLESHFAQSGVDRTLVIVASGSFAGVPFGALYDEAHAEYLIEQMPVAISPGLSMIEPRALGAGPHAALQAALTQAVAGYPALAAAGAEINEIRRLVGGKALLDEAFITAALDRELVTTPYEIVHIASHGQFGEDPENTFLLTFDGRIGMGDLADLVSHARFRDNPLELLTLSACQTAVGDDRAMLGLAGVAVRAGARSTLASLWSVNDPATARLMRAFYGHLLEKGMSRARALQLAQQELLDDAVHRHPAYWSSFVLVGSWR